MNHCINQIADIQNNIKYFNREISLISFNERILEEAKNSLNPLLERLKFLSISVANLDEFFMIRAAWIKDQIAHEMTDLSIDGLTPMQQLELIYSHTMKLMIEQEKCWVELKTLLNKENVEIASNNNLTDNDLKWLKDYFFKNIFPALTPIAIDPAHPFPLLPNLGLAIVMHIKKKHKTSKIDKNDKLKLLIPLPQKLNRFIKLPSYDHSNVRFIALEDILTLFKMELFPDADLISSAIISITRDSELEISEEAEDLVRHFEYAVKKRKSASIVLLKVSINMPNDLREFVISQLKVTEEEIIEVSELMGLSSIIELYDIERPDLKFKPHIARYPERINDYGNDCFKAIHTKDMILHHPYESYDVVIQFLRQAASDPDVVAIKQTLYRTSSDSEIVKALIEAAEAGKAVTAVVELKARFDEEANIKWARNLERAGAQVVYGLVGLKTHAKISLVIRREGSNLTSYAHFGTGNYNPETAKFYSDLSLFTCDHYLCQDAAYLFNFLTGYSPPEKFNKIAMAPLNIRQKLLELINQEIENAKNGLPAIIWIKVNSLVDEEIIDALYNASIIGVKIDLIVRGICCLKPGIKGLSENIKVKSIVGRFLEHARIYCFANGHEMPSSHTKVFISSSDLMQRNLNRRIEIMVPIENHTVHSQVLNQIMVANLKDEKQSYFLNQEGNYTKLNVADDSFSAHEYFINTASLSGRGSALNNKNLFKKQNMLYNIEKNR